ncbi:putative ethylene-inducible protein hever [Coemansia reversa NRRL 1564]|uniref:pyridoxal 5'-phosphate synthase (glutamine hydrolyzing) n=1 Tax=Coemansia reversa (strain ATCC 12441 / NRRL 1564) TaxID=763665 RepID=A0A2G5B7T5_COERN|nr:putative ethylene-inducible protein hever [Coemansia reversa NRRL 1564]|eukprot:PIA15096.1 putative ethylene-inducible protein hever [Coemansia reversa NRRL 1564]
MTINEPETKTNEQREKIKLAFTKQLIGGVLAIVTTVNQATVAETYGARGVIVMNYKYNTATIKDQAPRGTDPVVIRSIMGAVHLPVIGRVRLGHIAEARIMQACGVSAIEECADVGVAYKKNIEKHSFNVPVICYANNLESALQRISEGATMIVSKDYGVEAAGGSNLESVPNIYIIVEIYEKIQKEIVIVSQNNEKKLLEYAKQIDVPLQILREVVNLKRLNVPFFAGGGVMLPLDVAMLMRVGYDGVVASNQLFAAPNAEKRMRSLVMATVHYKDPKWLAYISENIGGPGSYQAIY